MSAGSDMNQSGSEGGLLSQSEAVYLWICGISGLCLNREEVLMLLPVSFLFGGVLLYVCSGGGAGKATWKTDYYYYY